MEITNKKGQVIGKIQMQSPQGSNLDSKLNINLKPGEGKAFYIADAVDNKFTQ